MDHLSQVLARILHKRGLAPHANAALMKNRADAWLRAALPAFATQIGVVRVQNAELVIGCVHSIAAQECQARIAELITYLQRELPSVRIESVRIIRT